jgi:hypothetical protein
MTKTSLALIIALTLVTATACDRSTVIKKSISYQGDIMQVKVFVKIDGRKKHDFTREFNVAGLDKEEKEAIAKHIMDSVDVPDNAGK